MHCKPDDTTISQKIKETISELTYFDYHISVYHEDHTFSYLN